MINVRRILFHFQTIYYYNMEYEGAIDITNYISYRYTVRDKFILFWSRLFFIYLTFVLFYN